MTHGQGSALPVPSDLPVERNRPKGHVDPEPVKDFYKLREMLSRSRTRDSYCGSALYFAVTGRGEVWTVACNDGYVILLPHPNQDETLLVFFPFVDDVYEFVEQVRALCNCRPFLEKYKEVLLARIPASVALEYFSREWPSLDGALEKIDEKKLDWVYPSYDIALQRLVKPEGGKLKTYRKKINKFKKYLNQNIEVIKAKRLSQYELEKAVSQVNKNWIRAKLKGGLSRKDLEDQGITLRDLMAPYQTLARLSRDITSQIDGVILKRGTCYIAFSFWERPANGRPVPCYAALPCSYEKGLSEYLYYCIADQLGQQGYEKMCIGGSETASLDQFKKKLDPVATHMLQTIRFLPQKTSATAPHSARTVASIGTIR